MQSLIILFLLLSLSTQANTTGYAESSQITTPTPTPGSHFTGDECDTLHWDTNIAALGHATAESTRENLNPGMAIDGNTVTEEQGWSAVGEMSCGRLNYHTND